MTLISRHGFHLAQMKIIFSCKPCWKESLRSKHKVTPSSQNLVHRLVSIRSVGGGAANAAWTAIRLRALEVSAKDAESEHAAMGTARLAWRGIGHDA